MCGERTPDPTGKKKTIIDIRHGLFAKNPALFEKKGTLSTAELGGEFSIFLKLISQSFASYHK
jgi:hypothetical protein